MHIQPFGVEEWMNATETLCSHNLAETCVASLTVEELLALSGRNSDALAELLPMRMTYGAIEGSDRLRDAIRGLYAGQGRGNVLVTHGTIGANELVHKTLVSRGDRVVAVVPTYQQHYSIPESLGAEVRQLWLTEADGWLPDLDALREMAGGARLIALTNPNNPTGAEMPLPMMEEVVAIARDAGAWLLADEVYRGTSQASDDLAPSFADLYEKGISTAGMSKAFSLAGLRLGWIVAPGEVIAAAMVHRDYNTISVGRIDDHFAALALEAKDRVLARSRAITRANLAVLADWVAAEPLLSMVPPAAGTTAFVRCVLDMPSREICTRLLEDTGVLLTPGSALGMEGYLRVGFANAPEVLAEGLPKVSAWLGAQGPSKAL